MKIRFRSFALAAVLLTPVAPVHAAEPLRLKPSSPWHAHHEREYCRLGRSFGVGDDMIQIVFEQHEPSDNFSLLLIGKKMRKVADPAHAWIAFGPTSPSERYFYTPASVGELPAWMIGSARLVPLSADVKKRKERGSKDEKIDVSEIAPEQEAAVREILIDRPLSKPVILETGSMARPFAALRLCTDKLITEWGLDAEQHKTAQSKPQPISNPGSWVTSNDYPAAMWVKGQTGIVEFRLIVDTVGRVESCHIQVATKPAGFNDVVCDRISKRATFRPALDKDGQPMRSYYQNTVRFQF